MPFSVFTISTFLDQIGIKRMHFDYTPRVLKFLLLLTFWPAVATAELMTVGDLRDLIDTGPKGELAATSYVQGVVDGMMGMDSLHQKEQQTPTEFCGLSGPDATETPVKHPAYRTKEVVSAWEKYGRSMDALAVDMLLAYLTTQYSCTGN